MAFLAEDTYLPALPWTLQLESLKLCVCRICVAAFAQAMLAGETQPGVWFPEEREALQNRRALLQSSAEGCVRFELNRPPWALESAPRRLGFGIYID